jgi:hypothetical protein
MGYLGHIALKDSMPLSPTAIRNCSILPLAYLLCSQALAQSNPACEPVNSPALAGFDFTEHISRWGTQESFDLDSTHYHVRNITVNRLPIFDETNEKEDNAIFRWINRVHIPTRQKVIRDQLLFEQGSEVNSQILAENERLLRQQKYAADSKIRVLDKCGEEVDLEVVTREVWTLVPGVSFHSSGGDTSFDIGVRDSNALGTGQRVSLFYANDANRSSYKLGFENPNIGSTRRVVKVQADDSTDGYHYIAEYELPFYSLDSRKAWRFAYESTKEILTQYQYGKRMTEVQRDKDTAEISRGFSAGLKNGKTRRFLYGLREEKILYGNGLERPSPAALPTDLTLAYPFFQYESIEDNFAVAYNISQMYRTEDLSLGKQLRFSVGYAPTGDRRLILQGAMSDTLLSQRKMLLRWNSDWYGRWNQNDNAWEDTLINFNFDFHRGQTEKRTLYMGFSASKAINLNNGEQLTLGGSTGLRGFDSHFLNGDAKLKFTIEERYFSDYQLLQLLRIGYAGFFDVGKVYGDPNTGADSLYKNVGLGLRLAPSKTDEGRIIHIDLAYPLGSNIPGGKSLQLVIEAKTSF